MINPKAVTGAAVTGFGLSFFVGLISGIFFGVIVFRAFLFAIIFGFIAVGAFFLFRQFLYDGKDLDIGSEGKNNIQTNHVVDISVGDEPLPDDENGPDFYVDNNVSSNKGTSHVKTESVSMNNSISATENVSNATNLQNTKNIDKISGEQDKVHTSKEEFRPVQLGSSSIVENSMSEEDLDVLPDIGDISLSINSPKSEVLENTDFAVEGTVNSVNSTSSGSSGTMDTDTIAKAIRTVLSKDS